MLRGMDRSSHRICWALLPDSGTATASPSSEVETLLTEVPDGPFRLGRVERTDFYGHARDVAAAVRTNDPRPYACFLLATGVQ